MLFCFPTLPNPANSEKKDGENVPYLPRTSMTFMFFFLQVHVKIFICLKVQESPGLVPKQEVTRLPKDPGILPQDYTGQE